MRTTLHVVPGDEVPFFFQAYVERRSPAERRGIESLLVQAGLCGQEEAGDLLQALHRRVLDVLAEKGPSTVRTIGQAVPELKAQVRHNVGKSYAGQFSVGSRLVPGMCALGLLIRARPRGTWRSNLHTYAALSDWLPDVDLEAVTPQKAQAWLARHYLSAFGPATPGDVQWWTGFSGRETKEALQPLRPALVEGDLEGAGEGYLMLADDARRLDAFDPPGSGYAFFLPGLDPYIMGRRFLSPEHRDKVFDRAGNAVPTVWSGGRVVGVWKQRRDGSVVYGLFEPVSEKARARLEERREQLEAFLEGESLSQRTHTRFIRALK